MKLSKYPFAQVPGAAAIATLSLALSPGGLGVADSAIAAPIKRDSCKETVSGKPWLGQDFKKLGAHYVLNDVDDYQASVNVREKPTVQSSVQYVAPSGTSRVSILKVVTGSDASCWLQVQFPLSDRNNSTGTPSKSKGQITGWVRGDLITIPWSKY